jgi:hypothetical protein
MEKNETVVKMMFGSHLYGLDHAGSDTDYKGIVLPTAKQILMQQADFEISASTGDDTSKNSADDIDDDAMSLMKFVKLAMKGETIALDMLHASPNKLVETSPIWEELQSMRTMFYTKNIKSYIGYVRKQAAKYGVKGSRLGVLEEVMKKADLVSDEMLIPESGGRMAPTTLDTFMKQLPIGEHSQIVVTIPPNGIEQTFYEVLGRKFQSTLKIGVFREALSKIWESYGARAQAAKDNEGIDWKAISHALRAGYQAKHIYEDGGFSYPLPETDYIFKVKMGELDFMTEVQPVLEALVADVEKLSDESDLPEKVDSKFWNDWLLTQHYNIVKEDQNA